MGDFVSWSEYEKEKARLQSLNLSPVEYDRAIKALLARLKL